MSTPGRARSPEDASLLAHFARGGRARAKTEENFLVAAPPSYERPSLTLLDSAKLFQPASTFGRKRSQPVKFIFRFPDPVRLTLFA